jgi:hypothetical protein
VHEVQDVEGIVEKGEPVVAHREQPVLVRLCRECSRTSDVFHVRFERTEHLSVKSQQWKNSPTFRAKETGTGLKIQMIMRMLQSKV